MVRARVLQVLTFLAFGVCVVLAIRLLDRPAEVKEAKAGQGSVGVAEAISVGQERNLGVTGYLFVGGGWPMRLCAARTSARTPRCIGPFLYVENLDQSSFNM
ncbi:MAG: hypothetical protein QOI20_2180, partial [Acidimicrobiaceae bacterium]|nr:hypothetical protein [Acidimicrobiaceae bacterium]